VQDERFATGRARRKNARELTAELDQGFNHLPMDTIAQRLDAADMVWAVVQTPAEVAADPQAASAFLEIEAEDGSSFRSPGAPASFPGADSKRRPRAPRLGEHSREVLAGIGYTEGEIDALLGTFATPA
jgi:crotonobetainyl-CoA:carnitine CoA-transferase CaiB-like acyl-CoA transferase